MRTVLPFAAICAGLALIGAAMAQTPPAQPDPAPQTESDGVEVIAPPQDLPKAQPADPRTLQQRARDRRAFERCVLRAQSRSDDAGAYNPLAPDPVELCRQRTSMQTQASVPTSR